MTCGTAESTARIERAQLHYQGQNLLPDEQLRELAGQITDDFTALTGEHQDDPRTRILIDASPDSLRAAMRFLVSVLEVCPYVWASTSAASTFSAQPPPTAVCWGPVNPPDPTRFTSTCSRRATSPRYWWRHPVEPVTSRPDGPRLSPDGSRHRSRLGRAESTILLDLFFDLRLKVDALHLGEGRQVQQDVGEFFAASGRSLRHVPPARRPTALVTNRRAANWALESAPWSQAKAAAKVVEQQRAPGATSPAPRSGRSTQR
ncbi:hypothetical protein [Streptomyces sp. MNP-20]|uniref:hypothetical protein n=1 Tax=Streptomyces sp. MNP-20 TaxID=2721165 RepID=UPI0035C7D9AA